MRVLIMQLPQVAAMDMPFPFGKVILELISRKLAGFFLLHRRGQNAATIGPHSCTSSIRNFWFTILLGINKENYRLALLFLTIFWVLTAIKGLLW
jgi:hypothetical protein